MSQRSLSQRIKKHFFNKGYKKVVSLMDKYLADHEEVTDASIAYCFGISLLYTGNIEEANKYLNLTCTLSDNYKMKINISLAYRKVREYLKAKIVLETLVNDPDYNEFIGYYLLAKTEFYSGNNYERALELFQKSLEYPIPDTKKISVQKYIEKAQKHLQNGTSKIDYDIFKQSNNTLERGHIVYLKRPRDEFGNISSCDSPNTFYRRTYLIFDITGNKAYALGLTNDLVTPFKLQAAICNNPSDKYILSKIVTFDLDSIESVVGKVEPEYFNEIAYHLYHSYHNFCNSSIPLIPDKCLNVNLHNVIVVYNEEEQREEYLFVTSIEDEYYSTIKLNVIDGIFIPSEEAKDMNKDTHLYDVILLDDKITDYILYTIETHGIIKR